MNNRKFTTNLEKDEDWFVAFCPELDIASQGRTMDEARSNLAEAVDLFFEVASPSEIHERTQP